MPQSRSWKHCEREKGGGGWDELGGSSGGQRETVSVEWRRLTTSVERKNLEGSERTASVSRVDLVLAERYMCAPVCGTAAGSVVCVISLRPWHNSTTPPIVRQLTFNLLTARRLSFSFVIDQTIKKTSQTQITKEKKLNDTTEGLICLSCWSVNRLATIFFSTDRSELFPVTNNRSDKKEKATTCGHVLQLTRPSGESITSSHPWPDGKQIKQI